MNNQVHNNFTTILFTISIALYGRIDRPNGASPTPGSTFYVLQGSRIVFNCYCKCTCQARLADGSTVQQPLGSMVTIGKQYMTLYATIKGALAANHAIISCRTLPMVLTTYNFSTDSYSTIIIIIITAKFKFYFRFECGSNQAVWSF